MTVSRGETLTSNDIKQRIGRIANDLVSVTETIQAVADPSPTPFDGWRDEKDRMEREMAGDHVRIAVVGAIKSGKSTVVNDLVGGDYLKRGAGVVTSIVTRVRPHRKTAARLFLKSWDDVNEDMRQALVLFPDGDDDTGHDDFDIRRERDRQRLDELLHSLNADRRVIDGALDVNSLLLSSYLKGYPRLHRMVSADHRTKTIAGSDFHKYKDFVGDDSLAVYLRDVEVCVPPSGMFRDGAMEIADCQGSDSPNPRHLTMIQDYLTGAHLIVYVISSRTGFREADIRFLDIIKKMGLAENLLFVLNCDMSEHESAVDLRRLIDKTREDVSVIRDEPRIFTFSALYGLFTVQEKTLSPKDRLRLEQWKLDKEMVALHAEERGRFLETLAEILERNTITLLYRNQVERLHLLVNSLADWTELRRIFLRERTEEDEERCRDIVDARDKMKELTAMVRDTLSGTREALRRELETDTDRYLDGTFGDIGRDVTEFIAAYTITAEEYEREYDKRGFSGALYSLFQKFKRAVDGYMAENVTPRLFRFIRDEEEKIQGTLTRVAGSYNTVITDAVNRYNDAIAASGVTRRGDGLGDMESIDIGRIKRTAGLTTPSLSSTLHYTSRVRTESMLKWGVYRAVSLVRKAIKKDRREGLEGHVPALKNGITRIKEETRQRLMFGLNDYRQNLKFQYLFKLNACAMNYLADMLDDRFALFDTDMSQLMTLLDKEQAVKEASRAALDDVSTTLDRVTAELVSLKDSFHGEKG